MLEFCFDTASPIRSNPLTVDVSAKAFPFYMSELGYFTMGSKYYTRRDAHESYLIVYTVSGEGQMSYKGKSCLLKQGSMVIVDCRLYHEYRTVSKEPWAFYYVHFGSDCMSGYRKLLLDSLTVVQNVQENYITGLFEKLFDYSSKADLNTYALHSQCISSLLTEMINPISPNSSDIISSQNIEIQKLAEYIRDNCEKELSLDKFMSITHLSKYYLIHQFTNQIGMSPYRYLHFCRISRSQILLHNPEYTITYISSIVGYSEPVVFIRHFKDFHGITPGEYRKNAIQY